MNNFFIMMVGIPGSGKSYYANKYVEENKFDLPTVIISSDDYRKRLFGDENDQTHNSVLFNIINSDIKKYLISGVNVIFDATNTSLKNRLNTLRNIHGVNCDKIAWVIATPVDKCIEQDKNRERSVGVDVINKFVRSYQFPQKFEGFNHIWINDYRENELPVFNYGKQCALSEMMMSFDQKNPHHKFSLGEHCNKLFQLWFDLEHKWTPHGFISCYHDVGKMFTQTIAENGVGHYYSHDSVGTYFLVNNLDILVATCWDDIFEELFFVNYHMKAFDFKTEKAVNKYRKLFGEELYNNLMQFNVFDKMASGTYEEKEKAK